MTNIEQHRVSDILSKVRMGCFEVFFLTYQNNIIVFRLPAKRTGSCVFCGKPNQLARIFRFLFLELNMSEDSDRFDLVCVLVSRNAQPG